MSISTSSYIEPARRSGKLLTAFAYASLVLMLVFMGIHITHLLDPADSTFLKHYTNARVSRNVDYSTYGLVEQPCQRANENYSNIGGPRPLSWIKIGQNAVDIMQGEEGVIFWLFGIPLSVRAMLLMAALVVVFADPLSAFFWGMAGWMGYGRVVCLCLIDFHLRIVAALEIVVSYIPEKRLVGDGERGANVPFPTTQEELSGAAEDPLTLGGHTKCVQEDLEPILTPVPGKLAEPPTPVPSAKPIPTTDASHNPVNLGIDAPGGSHVPIITPGFLNSEDKVRGRKKSTGESTDAAIHIVEIEKLQSYLTENAEGLLAMLGAARLLFEASGAGTPPTIKPITLVSKVSSPRSTDVSNRSRKEHTGVSGGGYGPGIRFGGRRPVEQKQVQKKKPPLGKGFAGARNGEVKEIQPYFVSKELEEDLVDDGSVLAVLGTPGVTAEASKVEGTPPPSSTGVRAASGVAEPEIRPFISSPFIALSAQDIRPVKALNPLENQLPCVYKGGYELSSGLERQERRYQKRDQKKKPTSGAVFAPALWEVEGHKSYFDELAESEWQAEQVGGENVLAILDSTGIVSGARNLETTLPAGSASSHVSCEAPELIVLPPASSTSIQVYEALKLEVAPPTFPPVVISEAPTIRQAKLENPLKKRSPGASSGGCGLSLKLGKQRKGNRKRNQAKVSVDGETYDAPGTRKAEEPRPDFTSKQPEEDLVDGGSILTLNTIGVALEAPGSESAPPAGLVSVQVISKVPIAEGIAPASRMSTLDAASLVSDAPKLEIPTPTFPPITISEIPSTGPAKLEDPLKKGRPRIRGYGFSLRLGRREQGGRRHDQAGKPAIGKFATTHTKGMGEEWQFSLRGKRACLSTLLPRNRHRISKRVKISAKSFYKGPYTAQRVVGVSGRRRNEVQTRVQRVSEELSSDAMMLDRELGDIYMGRDVFMPEQSVDTQVVGGDVLMSGHNFGSIAVEGAVLAREKSVNNPTGQTGALIPRQPGSAEILASQLGRYAESVTSMTQVTGGHKALEGSELLTVRWGKSLKKKRTRFYSTISNLKSHHRRPKVTLLEKPLPLGQKSRYTARRAFDIHLRNKQRVKARTERIGKALQTVTPENSGFGPKGVLGSDTNQLQEPEEWSLVAASPEALENMMKEILSLEACMSKEELRAVRSVEVSLRSESGGEWDGGGGEDENKVKTGTTAPNDVASSEPAIALPSTRVGTELKSLNDAIASEKEGRTSTSGRIGVTMQREQESGLPGPAAPTTEEEPKWAVDPGLGNGISGTLSSLIVPPEETATNAWGATNVPQLPTTTDRDDEFTDIFGPIPIGTKPFVSPDSPPTNPKAMNPLLATTSALASRGKPVSMRSPVGAIHEEVGWASNMPDHFNTPCVPQTFPNSRPFDPDMSPTNQALDAAEAEQRLSEFDWTSEDTQKLEEILGALGTQAASEKKAKDIARLSSLDLVPGEDLEELVRREEERLNELWDMEERARKEEAAKGRLLRQGIVRDIRPLRARRA